MDPRHRLILQKNYQLLEKDLDLKAIESYLYQQGVLLDHDMERLRLPLYTETVKRKIFLTEILPNRGKNAYDEFINALKEEVSIGGRDDYIVRALEDTDVTEEEITNAKRRDKSDEPSKDTEYDFAIFNVAESSYDTLFLKQYLEEQLRDDKGNFPNIWHEQTVGDYGELILDSMENGLKQSRYYLLYVDSHYHEAYEGKFKKDLLIMNLFEPEEKKKKLVPVMTRKDLKRPFGTAHLKPIILWKLTKGETMESFVTSGVRPDTKGQKYIEDLRKWFIEKVLPERGNHQATASEAADSMSRLSMNDSVQS